MEAELRRKIDEILGPMYCPEDYSCVEAGLERLRETKTDGRESFLACLRGNPVGCRLAAPRGSGHECHYVLRASLSDILH